MLAVSNIATDLHLEPILEKWQIYVIIFIYIYIHIYIVYNI